MIRLATLSLLLLQLTAQTLAVPAPADSPNKVDRPPGNDGRTLVQNVKSDNASNVIKHPVDNSLITLFIETNEQEKMTRADLVSALYGSRNYIKSKLDEHANDPPPVLPVTPSKIPNAENPFNSTPFYAGDCVFIATSGPNIDLWSYASLKDVVQGLMDVTFYPYKNEVGILTFAVHHDHYGFIGSGSLSTRDAAVQGAVQGSS